MKFPIVSLLHLIVLLLYGLLQVQLVFALFGVRGRDKLFSRQYNKPITSCFFCLSLTSNHRINYKLFFTTQWFPNTSSLFISWKSGLGLVSYFANTWVNSILTSKLMSNTFSSWITVFWGLGSHFIWTLYEIFIGIFIIISAFRHPSL